MKLDFDSDRDREDFLKTRVETMGLDGFILERFLKNNIRTIGGIVRRSEKELRDVLEKYAGKLPEIEKKIESMAIDAQVVIVGQKQNPPPVFGDDPDPLSLPPLSIEEDDDIIATLSEFFGYEKSQIEAKSRKQDVVRVRDLIVYLLRKYGEMSYPAIGRLLGGRDHTTIIHAFRKMESAVAKNPGMEEGLAALIEKLRAIKERKLKAEEELKQMFESVQVQHVRYRPDPNFKEIPERNQKILELYREGLTYQNIGGLFGVSRERVRQIVIVTIRQIAVNESVTKGIVMDTAVLAEEESKRRQSAKESKRPKKESKEKRWSKYYAACRTCGTTAIPHVRQGLCENCTGQIRGKRRDDIIRDHNNQCDKCGISRGEATRDYGRDFYIMKSGQVFCRKCFLGMTGKKLGTRPRR